MGGLPRATEGPFLELPCLDDWLIGYSLPQCQHVAVRSLERKGFEAWFPIRKVVTRRQASSISSKTRHRRRFEIVERTEPVLGCYLFLRRLYGAFALSDIRQLDGVGGLCRIGDTPATIRDLEVECLRLAESDGKFNVYGISVPGTYRLSIPVDPRIGHSSQWYGLTKFDNRSQTVILRAELGRLVRLIQALPIGMADP